VFPTLFPTYWLKFKRHVGKIRLWISRVLNFVISLEKTTFLADRNRRLNKTQKSIGLYINCGLKMFLNFILLSPKNEKLIENELLFIHFSLLPRGLIQTTWL